MGTLQNLDGNGLPGLIQQMIGDIEEVGTIEQAAQLVVKGMCDTFKDGSQSQLVLSRIFHSFEYGALPKNLQDIAANVLGTAPENSSKWLSLLGTYGDEEKWRKRTLSEGHQAIPLTRDSISKIPMISRLFQQIGFDLGILLGESDSPGINISGIEQSYGIFYVENAPGSPYIPGQDFVNKYSVKSVIGSGVMLPNGDISVYIAFCRTALDSETALKISPLMSLFWQILFPVIEKGFFV